METEKEEFLKVLSQVICGERKIRKWTQDQLSEKSGLDRSYISDIERGKRNPTLNALLQIAEGLSLPLSVLMLKVEFILEKGSPVK